MSRSNQYRQYIYFSDQRGEYKFLSNIFPAPFLVGNDRWRTVVHYFEAMKTNDLLRREQIRNTISASEAQILGNDIVLTPIRPDWNCPVNLDAISSKVGFNMTIAYQVLLEGITQKFLQNAELGIKLKNTYPKQLIYENNQDNVLGKLLMFVRDNILPTTYGREKNNEDIILSNLQNMLESQGYEILEPLVDRTRGLEITKKDGSMAIVDIYIEEKYPESRLKQIIDRYKKNDVKPTYIIVGYLEKAALSKRITRISTFNNIRYFSPSELLVASQNHVQNPPVRILSPNDPLYNDENMKSLPEISVNNKLSKDIGLRRGEIIEVMDFSPHYRRCI